MTGLVAGACTLHTPPLTYSVAHLIYVISGRQAIHPVLNLEINTGPSTVADSTIYLRVALQLGDVCEGIPDLSLHVHMY